MAVAHVAGGWAAGRRPRRRSGRGSLGRRRRGRRVRGAGVGPRSSAGVGGGVRPTARSRRPARCRRPRWRFSIAAWTCARSVVGCDDEAGVGREGDEARCGSRRAGWSTKVVGGGLGGGEPGRDRRRSPVIERETSIVSITVASSRGTWSIGDGRASATTRNGDRARGTARSARAAASAGVLRHEVREQVHVGEPDDVARAPPLDEEVQPSAIGTRRRPSRSSGEAKVMATIPWIRSWSAKDRSQLPEVDRTTWRTRRRRSSRATWSRSRAAASANFGCGAWLTRCRPGPPSGLGVDEVELADVGKRVLARVADLDDEDRRGAGRRRPAGAASRAARAGRSRGPPARRRGLPRATNRRAASGVRASSGSGWTSRDVGLELGTRRRAPRRAASRGARPGRCAAGTVRSMAPPNVTTPRRLPRWEDRWAIAIDDALGDVGLAAIGGAEGHRGRAVEQRATWSARAPGRGSGRAGPVSGGR